MRAKRGRTMGNKTPTGNWKRETNRQRRGGPEPLVLVGFGKYDLADMIKFIDTDNEERLVTEPFQKGWPPRYRRASACTQEEIENFRKFTTFITNVVAQ